MTERRETTEPGRSRAEEFERRVEIPLMVLSLLILPVLIMPAVENLSASSLRALEVLGAVIWAGFAVQYVVLLYLSDDRWQMIRTHKLDLLLVVLPFLRPLRIVRIVRMAEAGVGFTKFSTAVVTLARRPGFATTVATVGGLIVLGGVMVSIAEDGQPGSTIASWSDGLWWALVTCTTVGYGDEFPVTGTGRVVAVLLMLGGISGLSVITANVAAYFVSVDDDADDTIVDQRLHRIEIQLGELTRLLSESAVASDQQGAVTGETG